MTTPRPDHPLDTVLAQARMQADRYPGTLAGLAAATGRVATALETSPNTLAQCLAGLTGCALTWLDTLGTAEDPDHAVRDTYDRADPLDECMSLDTTVPGTVRLTAIIEELGQLARTGPYDHNPTATPDHQLAASLTDIAALATTWQATQEHPA
ncbi:hypothetical protein [Actinomyces wuliandei]|uniref:hypothetical protein n=1 Tax=Actinomyces wuliandei TaxID=2057743 RepID=UPI00111AA426|nr:hypothetical protein [Actinomyces wuliandei]